MRPSTSPVDHERTSDIADIVDHEQSTTAAIGGAECSDVVQIGTTVPTNILPRACIGIWPMVIAAVSITCLSRLSSQDLANNALGTGAVASTPSPLSPSFSPDRVAAAQSTTTVKIAARAEKLPFAVTTNATSRLKIAGQPTSNHLTTTTTTVVDANTQSYPPANATSYSASSSPSKVPNTSVAEVCMLVPVYSVHYGVLATRLTLQDRLIEGETVPTVVVFDDSFAHETFCHRYSLACKVRGFFPVTLATLLGEGAYKKARDRLFSLEGRKEMPKLNPGLGHGGTIQMSAGRTYQSLKKFYGAAFARGQCSMYMVSDAESYPWKRHDLAKWLRLAAAEPFVVTGNWYRHKHGCTHMLDSHSDEPNFLQTTARTLNLSELWPMDRCRQFEIQPDQYWMYHPGMVQRALTFVEERTRMSFVDWWLEMRIGDSAFHIFIAQALNDLKDPAAVAIRNIPDEVQSAFPHAFQHCCACDGPFTAEKRRWHEASFEQSACRLTVHIWTPCMLTYVSPEALARFAVERLGYVGFFSTFLADFTPLTVLRSHPGLAWCVNNCFYPSVFHRLAVVEGAARQEMVDEGPELTHREFRAKYNCARFTAGRNLDLLPRHVKHLIIVISGADGGNITKSHMELTKAVIPHFVKLYVASEDDPVLPILWANLSDEMMGIKKSKAELCRTRFLEIIFFIGICSPVRYEWLLVIGDNLSVFKTAFWAFGVCVFGVWRGKT